MVRKTRVQAAATLLGLSLVLAGSSGYTGIAQLERAAGPDDALPPGIVMAEDFDASSVRLPAVGGGARYFAGTTTDKSTACVLVHNAGNEPDWFAGCGGAGATGEIVEASGTNPSLTVVLVRDDADTRDREADGFTRLHHNILVRGQAHAGTD
ncbi:hypothetical protein ACIPVK_19125 [Paeniglutamicibacter sp. MACA_103]|uniref:hypothetical protein n=1 Tax=Paeniglutamicibacter sp. MACA_103 TaxID=3377337 RepID=UPI0038942C8D